MVCRILGIILRIASSHIVGVRGYCRQKWCFKFKLSANSVMRGCVNAIRMLKGLVADLRYYKIDNRFCFYRHCVLQLIVSPYNKV